MLPRSLLLLLAALLALTACAAQPPAPTRQEQTIDGLTIGLEAPTTPKLNAAQDLVVTLADAQGQPVDGASVYLDLTMPAMPMGTNAPIAQPLGQGRYSAANVVMNMTGDWEITVVAEVDGVERSAVFTRAVVE